MIAFQGASYAYEEEDVLREVTFRVAKGQAAFLSGPNGAGKSTLLKIVNGLAFLQQGTYAFAGEPVTAARMEDSRFAKRLHQRIGYIWQNPDAQLFCSSVEEEIAFGPRQMGLSEAEVQRRVEDALALLELKRLRWRAPYSLSGGEKKRAALAAIFVMNPSVWTLDEPLNALDERMQRWVTEFLLELKRAGKTILFSSHDRALAEQLADVELRLSATHRMQVLPMGG